MPVTRRRTPRQRINNVNFERCLDDLRTKIEAVPPQHRPALTAAADEAQQLHDHMRRSRRQIDDLVADLGLLVEHARFHVAACRRELRAADPEGHFDL